MIRGFLVIFVLTGLAIVAFLGFRGQKSTGSPIELFPDMVRQMKVRAQAPLGFFADGRGSRIPVAGTVPLGYEMPSSEMKARPETPAAQTNCPEPGAVAFSGSTDYANTGKMGTNWGTGIPL